MQRLKTDKFALFSEIWNRFTDNCCTLYKPGAFITVDEQLFPSKARSLLPVPGIKTRQILEKILVVCRQREQMYNKGFPYVGKNKLRSANNRVSDRVVMQLMRPYLCKGRNVTTDSYFISLKLENQLKKRKQIFWKQ